MNSIMENICSKVNVRWNKISFPVSAVLIDLVYLALNLAYKDFNKQVYLIAAIYLGVALCTFGSAVFQVGLVLDAIDEGRMEQEELTKKEFLIRILFDLSSAIELIVIPEICNLFWSINS